MEDQSGSRSPDADTILTYIVGAVLGAAMASWTAAQITTRIVTGSWLPSSPLDSPGILHQVLTEPANPTNTDDTAAVVFYVTLTAVALIVGAITVAIRHVVEHGRTRTNSGARWATPRDLRPLRISTPELGRIVIGTMNRRLIATEPQHSIAVIGPPGTGKTTRLAIPSVAEWGGPVIATSVKDDLLAATVIQRRAIGDVWVFDPTNATSEPTAGWSPLDSSHTWQGALRMAAWLTTTARTAKPSGLQDGDFWYSVAQKLLAPLLHAAATTDATMADLLRWVDLQDEHEPLAALHATGDTHAIQAFAATLNREDRSRSSAYTTTETILTAYTDPAVLATTTATPAITPTKLLEGNNTLYICGPLHEQHRLQPLFTALLQHVIAHAYTHPPIDKPLLLVIDEAANIAPLPNLAHIASTARGVGIQLVTIWQDVAQIQHRYGQASQTVLNNHRAKLILPGISDTPTLDHITRLIGDHHTTQQSTTTNHGGDTSTTDAPHTEPLAPAHAIRQTKLGTGILIYGNHPPAQIKLRHATQPERRRIRPLRLRKLHQGNA